MVSLRVWLKRRWKGLSLRKFLLLCALCVVVFNEFLIYTLQAYRWNSLPDRNPEEDMVLLIVSDPQLQGYQTEYPFPVGTLARWDADRFMSKTFSRAHSYSNPDVILFLGDILDEGSKATASEFEWAVQRFHYVFYETSYTKTIVVAGDNDVGGDGDLRTPFLVERFEHYFENLTGYVSHKFIDFLKLDIREYYDDVPTVNQMIRSWEPHLQAPLRVVVNHETLMTNFKSSIYPILRTAKPNLLLSGHWHLSQMFTCETCLSSNADLGTWPYRLFQIELNPDFIDIDMTKPDAINEVMLPTCSYRMGMPFMGYGVAIINKSGSMKYTVIWLPCRYTVLKSYFVAFIILMAVFLIDYILSPLKYNQSLFV